MTLTVDASVVVKWSVAEEWDDAAKLLRAHRLDLHAPDLLLAEFVNVLWKKSRRGEIPDVQGYLDETTRLKEDITLHAMPSLIDRAGRISLALDHPVYDCLYLACAEETGSSLVTADERLVNKVDASVLAISVRYLGDHDFADDIGLAAVAPVIARRTVEGLAEAYDLLTATGEADASVARARLVALVGALSADERVDLLALGSFGQPNGPDWRTCHEESSAELAGADVDHLVRGGPFWRRGVERLFDATP